MAGGGGDAASTTGGAAAVFAAFLVLGLVSFGGPIAHVGYLRAAFVERRCWLDDARFAQLVALCHALPGPASSQLAFAIGLHRAGWRGAFAAFAGFTLPSALLMFAAARAYPRDDDAAIAVVHGLVLVAVVVVAHGVAGMARRLVTDLPRAAIAGLALLFAFAGGAAAQLAAIAVGAVLGGLACRHARLPASPAWTPPGGRRVAAVAAAAFAVALAAATALAAAPTTAGIVATCFRAGALVFGGGHAVLPLLEAGAVAHGIAPAQFLAGYGVAQAVPGPMFSFAAYLGALAPGGVPPAVGALLALCAIFAPGFLLLAAALPHWHRLVASPRAGGMIAGMNAAVVGLLAAALVDPLATQALRTPADVAIAGAGLLLVWRLRLSPLLLVAWCVAASIAIPDFPGVAR